MLANGGLWSFVAIMSGRLESAKNEEQHESVAATQTRSGRRRPKIGTVAWLTDFCEDHRDDEQAIRGALQRYGYTTENYKVLNKEQGVVVSRTEAPIGAITKHPDFKDFSAPAAWNPPCSLMRATFAYGEVDHRISHCGEEIIIPVINSIDYGFIMKRESDSILQKELVSTHSPEGKQYSRPKPLGVGQILRCQSSIPHFTWAAESGDNPFAEAWMCIRDISARMASIRDKPTDNPPKPPDIVKTLRENPDCYPMFSHGISEKVKYYRAAAGHQIQDLADRCDIDAAQLSRIEGGHVNVSLSRLIQLGDELGFDVLQPLTQPLWGWRRDDLFNCAAANEIEHKKSLVGDADWQPFIEPESFSIPKGKVWEPENAKEKLVGSDSITSWIVLEGVASFKTTDSPVRHYVETDGVLHLLDRCVEEIGAFSDTKLVRIICRKLSGGIPPEFSPKSS